MSSHKAHGRRRASGSVSEARPRDAQRATRRSRNQLLRISRSAGSPVEGLGQRAAVVVAASGLAMAVTVPAVSLAPPEDAGSSISSTATAAAAGAGSSTVTAPATASVTFDRAGVGSVADPDEKLQRVMTAGGDIEPTAVDGALAKPVASSDMTSGFGRRVNPLTGYTGQMHTGQDFGIACGTKVMAAADGTVKKAGWHRLGGGNRVVIDHGGGLKTTYNHLSSITVSQGQKIDRGQRIGASGTTGASTGCHLHFEVVVDGEKVDPLKWL